MKAIGSGRNQGCRLSTPEEREIAGDRATFDCPLQNIRFKM
jgi:hypothetical protein